MDLDSTRQSQNYNWSILLAESIKSSTTKRLQDHHTDDCRNRLQKMTLRDCKDLGDGHNNIEPFTLKQQEEDTKIDFSKFDYEKPDCHDDDECLESWKRRIDHKIFMDAFSRDPFVCTEPTKSKDDEIEQRDDSYNHREKIPWDDIPWDAPRVRVIMNDDEILALHD